MSFLLFENRDKAAKDAALKSKEQHYWDPVQVSIHKQALQTSCGAGEKPEFENTMRCIYKSVEKNHQFNLSSQEKIFSKLNIIIIS